ncbi:MAG: YbaB/EbfC family nucleoid-associated protein [Bdellovibrionales bacterium]|nr:YbaB/EbfC family nucleoid-associated protein [Bdellovibrionales bacterium]
MKGFNGGLQQLMKQANQMQLKMKKTQEELASRTFTGTSGGDAVQAKVSGDNQVQSITISPEVVSAGDLEMLQDLIVTAVNDALRTARVTSEEEMQKVTGGKIPGLF